MRRIPASLGLAVAGILIGAPALAAGQAAPTYVTSDPADGATVESAPSRVSATFSEPLDSNSTLQVFDQCGQAVDAGDKAVLGSRIDVGLAETPAGHYTAVYVAKGFSGATGETKGSFSFHVTSGRPCGDDGGHDHHGGPDDGDGDGHHEGHGGKDEDGGHEGRHGGGDEDGHEAHGGSSGEGHHGDTESGHEGHGGGGGADHDGSGHGGDHGKGGRGDDHSGGHPDRSTGGDGLGRLAAGRGGPGLAPTSTSVLIALALSIGMGALGGWVLRVSARS